MENLSDNLLPGQYLKKLAACVLAASCSAAILSGCSKDEEPTDPVLVTTVTESTTQTTETTPETSAFVTYTAQEYRDAGINELNSVPVLM